VLNFAKRFPPSAEHVIPDDLVLAFDALAVDVLDKRRAEGLIHPLPSSPCIVADGQRCISPDARWRGSHSRSI
jgi:hypothetical protein